LRFCHILLPALRAYLPSGPGPAQLIVAVSRLPLTPLRPVVLIEGARLRPPQLDNWRWTTPSWERSCSHFMTTGCAWLPREKPGIGDVTIPPRHTPRAAEKQFPSSKGAERGLNWADIDPSGGMRMNPRGRDFAQYVLSTRSPLATEAPRQFPGANQAVAQN